MFCKYCGKEIPENSKFCRYCGKSLDSTSRKEHPEVLSDSLSETSENVQYAGFWVRFGAYLIDFLGMMGGAFLMGLVLGYLFGPDLVDVLPDVFWNYFSYVIYSAFTLTIWSTTFGKYMYGLKVVNNENQDISFSQALKRSLLQPLSTLLFGIGYWNMNKNDKKQAWHDTKAETTVIQESKNLILAYIVTFIAVIAWFYLIYYYAEY